MIHFYCLAVEAGFYSDVVECLPVDPATWVRFPAGAGKIFSLYDNYLPQPGIEPRSLDQQANTLPRRCKSRLLPQGSRSVSYTYTL